MRRIIDLIITIMMITILLVGCFKGETSLEKKYLIGKSFNLEVTNTTKVYEEIIRYDAGDNIDFDMDLKEGKAKISLLSEENTEVYSGNLTKGEIDFVVNIIEKGNYKLTIELDKCTGDFEIKPRD